MPEIKHNFTGGKMNKDVDERLVPKGEYRHAENIQVSTSEGSDVGTIQNILGNSLVNNYKSSEFVINGTATCVGSVTDEKDDALYWLVNESAPNNYDPNFGNVTTRDMILQHKAGIITPVFVDLQSILLGGSSGMFGPSITGAGFVGGIDPLALTNIFLDPMNMDQLEVGMLITGIFGDVANTGSYQDLQFSGEIIAVDIANSVITINANFLEVLAEVFNGVILQFPFYVTAAYFKPVLGFSKNNLITGINIIDDMLFWTDGVTEPKKINIPRSIEGTDASGEVHTLLVNPDQNIYIGNGVSAEEKHITVIRKAPKTVLTVDTKSTPEYLSGTTYLDQTFLINPNLPVTGNLLPGMTLEQLFLVPDPNSNLNIGVGDIILLNPVNNAAGGANNLPPDEYQISVEILNIISADVFNMVLGVNSVLVKVQIVSIALDVSDVPQEYNWSVQYSVDQSFKDKFPRFSYRYKYQDGEYSTFAPFTSVIFQPGDFNYEVKEAYNLGMVNKLTSIKLHGYEANIPKDVVSVDLLYKESNSPVVYTIETLETSWITSTNAGYEVKPDQIRAALPENQLLRAWDNVPRTSLAQEITGNRIVYANYLQNYNMEAPKFTVSLLERNICDISLSSFGFNGVKSLKSIRKYSLGVSYLDKYGRQTPVFTNKNADITIPISKSSNYNQFSTQLMGTSPSWAAYYKVFVKETSSEYYNLALDRVYDARDGHVWLAFPSSDRNKVDEETFLILKKGVEGADPVQEDNRYKILAIENEAPDYIKTKIFPLGKVQETVASPFDPITNAQVFTAGTASTGFPIEGSNKIVFSKANWEVAGLPLADFDNFSVRFSISIGGLIQNTKIYEIISLNADTVIAGNYTIILNEAIVEPWLADASNVPFPDDTVGMEIYAREIVNSPQFDGRFFAKVKRDINIDNYIIAQATQSLQLQYQATAQLPFYYMADGSAGGVNTTNAIPDVPYPGSDSKLNRFEEWEALYASTGGSCWFIDACHFRGQFSTSSSQAYLNSNGLWSGVGTSSNDVPESQITGNGKGIWTDSSGQTFIDLSFGNVRTSVGNASPWQTSTHKLHTSDDVGPSGDQVDRGNRCASWAAGVAGCTDYDRRALYEGLSDKGLNTNNQLNHWRLGSASTNAVHANQAEVINKLFTGSKFKFANDPSGTIYVISGTVEKSYVLSHYDTRDLDNGHGYLGVSGGCCSYNATCGSAWEVWCGGSGGNAQWDATEKLFDYMELFGHSRNRRIRYTIPISDVNGNMVDPTSPDSTFNPIATGNADALNLGTIQFVEEQWVNYVDDQVIVDNPAVWETEPKIDVDLDVYYEADGTFPLEINNDTNYAFAPIGSIVSVDYPGGSTSPTGDLVRVTAWDDNVVRVVSDTPYGFQLNDTGLGVSTILSDYPNITFHRPDGSCVHGVMVNWVNTYDGVPPGMGITFVSEIEINRNVANNPVNLSWFNCYSFGNGVESDRIRDDYNQVTIDKGAKASSTLDEPYAEERRKYGLIYSGLYNSATGINNLNQFNAAEKITKDINPVYGSVQKLHSRATADGDLIALCEDRILKILANKDAVFNADGNTNITATNKVLGQAMPYSGNYGISTNPESFASESYRVYFTDRVRGSVMRLSKDGLTPVSDHGMKDWFRDNLKLNNTLIGSYDDKKDEYNIALNNTNEPAWNNGPITVSFREDVKGWVSFKDFLGLENGISCANEYYTFKQGRLWQHHSEMVDRNQFYNIPNNSSFSVILNEVPGSVKSFNTLNYEGSQSRIEQFTTDPATGLTDGEYYNLVGKKGWYVENIVTNLEKGSLNEFIKKEGKWFNYIKGSAVQHFLANDNLHVLLEADGTSTFDQAGFATQGLGVLGSDPIPAPNVGCTTPGAFNYDPDANIDDGSCEAIFNACIEPTADNYNQAANTDDGSCMWSGCTDPTAFNFANLPSIASTYNNGNSIMLEPCVAIAYGCTDVTAYNYDASANVNQFSAANTTSPCVAVVSGCNWYGATNYDNSANTNDGTCIWSGCLDQPSAPNYGFFSQQFTGLQPWDYGIFNYPAAGLQYGAQDDGSCEGGGCTDLLQVNYDATAIWDDGSCIDCNWDSTGTNAYNGIPITTLVLDTSAAALSNGQIAVEFNSSAPYLPYVYSLSGPVNASALMTSPSSAYYTPGQTLGGTSDSNSLLFHDLPAGTYTLTINGANPANICEYSVDIEVNVASAPLVLGCMDSTACNYNSNANTDNNSCEWTTCAGCIISSANNNMFQTGTTNDCIIPGSNNTGPCTIGCGDGNSDTDQGSWCCTYTIYGCTDPAACNATTVPNSNYTLIDNGNCSYTGCADDSIGEFPDINGNDIDGNQCTYPCLDAGNNANGYFASNYAPCADPNDPQNSNICEYDATGCTDPNACNYDFNATVDDGSCLLGFVSATVGDPNTGPTAYYSGALSNSMTAKHYVTGYPLSQNFETDLGLSITSQDPNMAQYAANVDTVVANLYKKDAGGAFQLEVTKSITVNQVFWNNVSTGATFGSRPSQNPYPWGTSQTSSSNYEFDIYTATNAPQEYALEIYSVINGDDVGKVLTSTANCGIYDVFAISNVNACSNPFAVNGCTDDTACNYNANATCDDNSCFYGTTGGFDCVNGSCQAVSCGSPQFPSLNACLTGGCGAN